jgi:hypothetical protein
MFNNMLMGAAGESTKATSFAVDNSAMFNKADAEYLAADSGFGTPTSANIGTLSMWFKRGNLGGSNLRLFTHGSGGSVQIQAYLLSANTLAVGNGTEVTTTQVFRDPHAWYHLVIRVDTSQGTAADRVRLYLNGSQITSFSASSYPSQNADIFTSTGWRIAAYSGGTGNNFDGYMSEVVYCDGQSLGPTSFGETDDNGVWRPIDLDDSGLFTVSSTAEAIVNSASGTNSGDLSTYTYSSVALGTASSTRAIYVFATGQGPASSNFDVNSMTVGGISATRVSDVTNSAEAQYVSELWRADVPSGTTGDIVVTWNSAMSQCGIIAWAVTGDHSLVDLQTTSDSTASFTLTNVPDGSVILAGRGGTGSRTHTWSSDVTENVDEVIADGVVQSGASSAKSTGGNFTVTCTPSTSDTRSRTVSIVLSPTQGAGINGFYLPFSAGTGAALGSNSAGSNTFTPAAANYTYNSTYLTIGSGTIDNNGAPGVSGRLNNPFSGDFTFSFTATAIAGSIFGCFDADELSTFATGTDDGGLDGMTKSWWYDDGGNGSGGAGSVGAGKIMYGNATQASSAIAAGSAVTITRTGSTIKITDDGSDHHTFSQTHEGPVYIMVGNRNITSKSMNFDSVSMTGSEAFAAVNSPTQTSDSPTTNAATFSPLITRHQTTFAAVTSDWTLTNGNRTLTHTSGSSGDIMAAASQLLQPGQKYHFEAVTESMHSSAYARFQLALVPQSMWETDASPLTGTNDQFTFSLIKSGGSGSNTAAFDNGSLSAPTNKPTTNSRLTFEVDMSTIGSTTVRYYFNGSLDTTYSSLGFADEPYYIVSFTGVETDRNGVFNFNFGSSDFTDTPTTGHTGLTAKDAFAGSAPAIEDPDDHFKEVIVDHDGSSTNFTIPWSTYNGTSGTYDTLFSIKRLADEKWFVIDSIRGLNKYFSWNATTSQTTDANVLSVSGTTGTLGSTLADDNYLVQMYRLNAQSSRDTSNSEGSITGGSNSLIISANATAGWSVCTYTGTGANGTFGHGLSQAPEWIRWYNTVSADGQTVYHAFNPSTPKDHYGNFDSAPTTLTNDDSTKFNDTAPTADVNSVGSADSTNGSSDAMWCFSVHSVNSFSKVGAFVGNGGADGSFAEASISPKSVVLKNANGSASGDDWYLVTDTRFLYNGDASTLAFNLTATEQATNLFDMLSNGIKLRTTNAGVNENTNTIVYQIIGSPFAGTTPATAR